MPGQRDNLVLRERPRSAQYRGNGRLRDTHGPGELELTESVGVHQFAKYFRFGSITDRDVLVLVSLHHVGQDVEVRLRPGVQVLLQQLVDDLLGRVQMVIVPDMGER